MSATYPYIVGQEVHSILRATFDAQNVHAHHWYNAQCPRELTCESDSVLVRNVYVFIVDIRESYVHARGMSSQGSIVYSFGVIVQPVSCALLNIVDIRTLFEPCKPRSPSTCASTTSASTSTMSTSTCASTMSTTSTCVNVLDHAHTRANDEFARDNLSFIIRAYDDSGECDRCIDNMSHSVWSWLNQAEQIEHRVPNALSRVISCSARNVDKVIMREVRALNMLIDDYVIDTLGSPSSSCVQVPSYIPQIRSPLIHEREQAHARMRKHSPLLCSREYAREYARDEESTDLMESTSFVIHIHPHPQ